MTDPATVSILGSTGHIGTQQVERRAADPDNHVVALAAAGSSLKLLAYQAVTLGVYGLAVHRGDLAEVHAAVVKANEQAGTNVYPEILIGPEAVAHAATGVEEALNAIDGVDGVTASFAALEAGVRVGVANTETLLTLDLLAQALPNLDVDSQIYLLNPALAGIKESLQEVPASRVLLTTPPRPAPLRGRRRDRTTINAYTGMDAGLTYLELSAVTDVDIDVVTHAGPVAALVELGDGRTLVTARPGVTLHGEPPANWQFEMSESPGVQLARGAAFEGGTYPLGLLFANNRAVRAHLEGRIDVDDILNVVARTLDQHESSELSLDDLELLEAQVARQADALIASIA